LSFGKAVLFLEPGLHKIGAWGVIGRNGLPITPHDHLSYRSWTAEIIPASRTVRKLFEKKHICHFWVEPASDKMDNVILL
jgi:hypothetical protein